MPINITAAGTTGTHSFQKTNVNLEDNYIYFNKNSSTVNTYTRRPSTILEGAPWIYRASTGSITGISTGTVVYSRLIDDYSYSFSSGTTGSTFDFTALSTGNATLDFPFVFNNQLNIQATFSNQQAVRYLTSSTPIGSLVSGNTYFIRNSETGLGLPPIYSFTSFTFTTAGQTGQEGPTLQNLQSSYSAASWTQSTANLTIGTYRGYQDWTVPVTGTYEFTVSGAPGRPGTSGAVGGGGAIVRGRVQLTRGEIITIAVGQRGQVPGNNSNWPASSGASWVVRKSTNTPLFVAGGGSSASNNISGRNAVLTINGDAAAGTAGTAGQGAPANFAGGGGGGFLSAGGNSSYGGGGGGFNNGLRGGNGAGGSSAPGGFGGGAGSDGEVRGAPGGAGGYSGGAAGPNASTTSGGGGGSYIIPSATNIATSTGTYEGALTLNSRGITNLGLFNTGTNEGSVGVTLVGAANSGSTLHPTAVDANANTNAIAVTAAGNEYHALVPITVDTTADTFNFPDAHGLNSGEALTYTFTGTGVG